MEGIHVAGPTSRVELDDVVIEDCEALNVGGGVCFWSIARPS